MDKDYCLSTPLHWIPKISFIPTVYTSATSPISSQPIVYPKVITFSKTTQSKGILTSMLNSKLGHRKEYFLFIGFGLKVQI